MGFLESNFLAAINRIFLLRLPLLAGHGMVYSCYSREHGPGVSMSLNGEDMVVLIHPVPNPVLDRKNSPLYQEFERVVSIPNLNTDLMPLR